MNLLTKSIMAPSLALFITTALYADENYTIKTTSLSEAIKKISEISKLPFIVDTNILKGKKASPIENVEGLQNALMLILKDTNLEAIISDETIVIRNIANKIVKNNIQKLDDMIVIGQQESYFEEYSSSSMRGDFSDRETPFATSIINKTLISDIQAQRLADTYAYSTGVTKVGKNADRIMIRGFQTDLQNIQVNGMSGLTSRMGSPSTANIEKMEVVKGPASVLYGNMKPGGFINIQTKKPETKTKVTLETSFQTYMSDSSSFGSDNGITTTFDSTGPIQDGLYYRLIAVGEKLNSYRNNVEFENLYIYPSILWDMNDKTSLLVALEYGKEKGSADDGLFVANHDISTAASINTIYQEKSDFDNDEGISLDINLEHFLNNDTSLNFSWRSVFHEDERKLYEHRKVINSTNVEDTTLKRRNRHQLNERDWHSFDTNLKYNTEVANVSHNIVMGLSGLYRNVDMNRLSFGDYISPNINIYNPILGTTADTIKGNHKEIKYYSTGLYLQDKISLTDSLSIVGSTRVDRTKIEFNCVSGSCVANNTKYSTDFVGSIGVIYNISDFVSIYSSYAQSYDPTSAERLDEVGTGLDSETSNQFEIGTKLNISETFNTVFSLYQINKENVAEKNSSGFYELKGEVESKGFETEVQWLPTKNWQFKTGFSYNKSEYVSGSSLGSSPKTTPKVTSYLFTRYNIPKKIYDGTLGITAGLVYRDKIYTSSSELKRVELPSFTRLDLGVHYSLKDWKFSLNVENVTDKVYYEGGINDYEIYPAEPRNITFNIKKTF